MAKYKYCEDEFGNIIGVKNTETGTFIPDKNTGYLKNAYLEWLAEGNTPDDAYSLDEIKVSKKIEIKNMFLNEKNSGTIMSVALGDVEVDADITSLQNAQSLVTSMTALGTESVQFRCTDNSFVTATLAMINNLVLEIIANGQDLYTKKWTLEAEIDSAEDAETVKAISW